MNENQENSLNNRNAEIFDLSNQILAIKNSILEIEKKMKACVESNSGNIQALQHDYHGVMEKFQKLLEKCIQSNVNIENFTCFTANYVDAGFEDKYQKFKKEYSQQVSKINQRHQLDAVLYKSCACLLILGVFVGTVAAVATLGPVGLAVGIMGLAVGIILFTLADGVFNNLKKCFLNQTLFNSKQKQEEQKKYQENIQKIDMAIKQDPKKAITQTAYEINKINQKIIPIYSLFGKNKMPGTEKKESYVEGQNFEQDNQFVKIGSLEHMQSIISNIHCEKNSIENSVYHTNLPPLNPVYIPLKNS